MSISTKTGDKGETSLLGGERVSKEDPRIEAYGTLDELNAVLGVALAHIKSEAISEVLTQVQNDLFTLGAELAALTQKELKMQIPRITTEHVDFLNKGVLAVEEALPTQKSFILPNGEASGANLHLARTVCRRAERRVVAITNEKNPLVLKYLNRLSDLLFLCARAENVNSVGETPVTYQ